MQEADEPSRLEEELRDSIPNLAKLYDRFANALDPFSEGTAVAEETFGSEVRSLFDCAAPLGLSFREFNRFVIKLCKRHLKAGDKPRSV